MTEALLPQSANIQPASPEVDRSIPLAILLDVDGVVTDPKEKKVTEPEMLGQLENQLIKGNVIALNTGRSNEWMINQVINPLAARLKDKSALKNFFAVGEKGLTWASFDTAGKLVQGVFDRTGKAVEGFDLSVFLDKETAEHFKTLGREAQELIARKYSHSTFFDNTKKAMVSMEMKDGYNQPEFAREQPAFTQELKDMLKRLQLEGKFNIDPTTIATDIQVPQAGKHLGTKRILDWLTTRGVVPKRFVAAGDSASDLEMADELKAQGKSFDFYYVNPGKPLPAEKVQDQDKKPRFNVITTASEFGKGTVEMFRKLSTS